MFVKNIKFRVYEKFNKSVCEVLEIDFKRQKVIALFRNLLPNIYDFDEVEFLQFVGLRDINKNDVYEKDLLSNGIDYYEVFFDDQNACFMGKSHNNVKTINELVSNGYYIDICNCTDKD